jgi:hypothetical protein
MADKATPLMLEALGRAAVEPAGLPLHGGKGTPALFAVSAAARQAAQRCKDDGLLRVVRTEARGKTALEICAVTDKGLAYLLEQVNPRHVLEDLVRALEARGTQLAELVTAAQKTQAGGEALKAVAEAALRQLRQPATAPSSNGTPPSANGSDAWLPAVLAHLHGWHGAGALEDCPLPELYRVARQTTPSLTIGHFHDGIRRLHAHEQIYLHPWTGPLYELPEPPLALLVGHEVAYYASFRKG